jgi:hypothetical protein
MTTIQRDTDQYATIKFENNATSNPFAFRGRYPLSIYSPSGGPTTLTLKKQSPADSSTYCDVRDASDNAITITLTADDWTNLSNEEQRAMMGHFPMVLVNGGAITKDLVVETGT